MAPLTTLIGRLPRSCNPERRVVELDGVFETADLLGPDRRDQILRGERVGHILTGETARLQRRRIEIDLNLAQLAAERIRDRGAGHGDQRRAQLVDADVGEVLLGETLARQRDLDDRNRGGAVIEDQRRRRTRRHLLDQRLRNRGDLGVGGADIDVGLEEDLDDTEAVIGIRDDMLDVVDRRRQRPLERRGDTPGHLIRRQPGILPDHADHGDPDVREDVRGRAQCGERSDDQKQQREHDEGIGPAQRNTDQCNHKPGIPRSRERAGIGGPKGQFIRADLPEPRQKSQRLRRCRPSLPWHPPAVTPARLRNRQPRPGLSGSPARVEELADFRQRPSHQD